jgi:hypothetical protein
MAQKKKNIAQPEKVMNMNQDRIGDQFSALQYFHD